MVVHSTLGDLVLLELCNPGRDRELGWGAMAVKRLSVRATVWMRWYLALPRDPVGRTSEKRHRWSNQVTRNTLQSQMVEVSLSQRIFWLEQKPREYPWSLQADSIDRFQRLLQVNWDQPSH